MWEGGCQLKLSTILRAVWRDRLALCGSIWLILLVIVATVAPAIAPYDPNAMLRNESGRLAALQPPSAAYWFGTTNLGRDVLSQVLMGARSVLQVGIIASIVTTVTGSLLGLISGFYKGLVDDLLMRIVEVAYSIPFEPLAILMLSLVSRDHWTIVLAIGMLFWRQPARVVRNQTLSLRERGYVLAARAAGAGDLRILATHLVPNLLPIAFVYVPVAFGNAILAEASISFLGFGNPDVISWGQIMRGAFTEGATVQAWWWALAPGLAITVTTAAVFFATRPFEVILNPRLRGE